MKDCGSFWDFDFRKLLANNLRIAFSECMYLSANKDICNIIEIAEKEEIANNDILRFYFTCSEIRCNLMVNIEDCITKSFFDYKIKTISEDRLIKFRQIVKESIPHDLRSEPEFDYYSLVWSSWSLCLVDVFLDEI